MRLATLATLILCLASLAQAHEFTGKVTRIVDGDTIDVRDGSVTRRVRLLDIDSPEKDQPYGKEATRALSKLILGKSVTVTWKKKHFDRLLSDLSSGSGMSSYSLCESVEKHIKPATWLDRP